MHTNKDIQITASGGQTGRSDPGVKPWGAKLAWHLPTHPPTTQGAPYLGAIYPGQCQGEWREGRWGLRNATKAFDDMQWLSPPALAWAFVDTHSPTYYVYTDKECNLEKV